MSGNALNGNVAPTYKKVTILIEDETTLTTVVFYKSHEPSFLVHWSRPEPLDPENFTMPREPQIQSVDIELRPLKDQKTGVVYTTKTETKGEINAG